MDLSYHVVNHKIGTKKDIPEAEVLDYVTKQHTQNDPSMSWARARGLANGQCMRARDNEHQVSSLCQVEVSVQ